MVERNPRSRAGGVHCPRCEQVELDERERDGILIDVCRSCRGVWLDRGELEKLIARATREVHEPFERDDTPPRGFRTDDFERDDGRHQPKKKRRWFESFGDIFD